ncbi:MAG: aminotransferase class V-fold PLP-dependent enzyme [Pseudomonadota bacterium]
MSSIDSGRRRLIKGLALGTAAAALPAGAAGERLPKPPAAVSPEELAKDERFWRDVGVHYDRTSGILNLEHGYWARMAQPVRQAYFESLDKVNRQNSYYVRRDFSTDDADVRARVAAVLGAHDDEVVITRNATEGFQNLVRQYRGLGSGDAVLFADVDYPSYKPLLRWLGESRGVEIVEVTLPPRCSQDDALQRYREAFDAHPSLKLAIVTHASNQHGLVLPVAEIAAEARQRGVDVICDAAQSWGLLNFTVDELGVDWAVFNLHKWIGAPLGTGAMYLRRDTLHKVAPYPGESDPENVNAAARIHSGTVNFSARLTVPAALDFHEAVGPANKEARLRYLRSLWTSEADRMPNIEVLGGANEADWSGIASLRIRGKNSVADATSLQQRLEKDFGVFTVIRTGLASGACVRVTPQVFNTPEELGRLVDALARV